MGEIQLELVFREGPATFGEMLKVMEMQEANAEGKTLRSMKILAELMEGRTETGNVYDQDPSNLGELVNQLMRAMQFNNDGPSIPDAFKDWK